MVHGVTRGRLDLFHIIYLLSLLFYIVDYAKSGDLYHFIFDICNSYHSTNPYHNFRHAVDVLQANYYFLCRLGVIEPMCPGTVPASSCNTSAGNNIQDLLKPLDIFALLMASVGHDVGHPGVNNNFMVRVHINHYPVLADMNHPSCFRLLHQRLLPFYIMIDLY